MEKPPSIACDICGGWHSTESHPEYKKEAREKRMAEIKARPDSAYRFDTLGFKSERKEEIEPWMHEVIEKAKDLGDDLQDSGFFIHVGPLEPFEDSNGKYPSVLSMINQKSFDESPTVREVEVDLGKKKITLPIDSRQSGRIFVSEHIADEKMSSWAVLEDKISDLLVLQERWVQTRDGEDLEKYKEAVKKSLERIVNGLTNLNSASIFSSEIAQDIEEGSNFINHLDTMEKRKEAVKYILKHTRGGVVGKGELVGVIFGIGDSIKADHTFHKGEPYISPERGRESIPYYYKNERIISMLKELDSDEGWKSINQEIDTHNADQSIAQEFYRKFIHALYVPHGSIEEQRKVLEKMLETTKDCPEQRLPIYNFYGKLVWPKPREEKKS